MKNAPDQEEIEIFYPENAAAWRTWLEKNHRAKSSVWLVGYNKSSGKPSVSWNDSVEAALCFGWIDSKKIKIDAESTHQFFSKRKAGGTWSKINKDKVERLIKEGLMMESGHEAIETAKKNGSWDILNDVEELLIPADLESGFTDHKHSKEYFLGLSKSTRKAMLQWIVLAKRPETRQNRIREIAELAAQSKKPKQF